jgi:magnesium-transporting ATPase (P-type)
MASNNFNILGLTTDQVIQARERFGQNKLNYKKENGFIDTVKRISKDPMIVLLLLASSIYFISGKRRPFENLIRNNIYISVFSLLWIQGRTNKDNGLYCLSSIKYFPDFNKPLILLFNNYNFEV